MLAALEWLETLLAQQWIVGAIFYITGSITINFATNVVKLSFNIEDRKQPERRRFMLLRPLWWIGIAIFVGGNVFNFFALSWAAQSLLEALGSCQFITNVFFAWILLKEQVTWAIGGCTLLILGGNVLVAIVADHQNRVYDISTLYHLYFARDFVIYMLGMTVVVIAMIAVSIIFDVRRKRAKLGTLAPWEEQIAAFCYAGVSGMIGTLSVLFAKSAAVLIRSSRLEHHNEFLNPLAWFILLAWFVTMLFWLYRLNTGLSHYDSLLVVPLFQMNWTLFSIITGGIYFQEFAGFTKMRFLLFFLAVALIVGGVYLLSWCVGTHKNKNKHQKGGNGRSIEQSFLDISDEDDIDSDDPLAVGDLLIEGPGDASLTPFSLNRSGHLQRSIFDENENENENERDQDGLDSDGEFVNDRTPLVG